MTKHDFDMTMHFVAQAIINLDSGLTAIEPGSAVHRALLALCAAVQDGSVRWVDTREPAAEEDRLLA